MNLVKIGPVGGSNGSCWDFKGRDQVAGIFLLSLAQKLFIHFSSFYMSMIVNHHLFGGFHGTKNSYGIESIGIYVKPNVNLKHSPQVKDEKVED
ncbi:hypothetical protein H5410_048414 [Solanum commersonii]|uniref:Uncharacterized protein n=1 Tax=Solanum commersonii TaxID=4109 RepID=A0A9J5XL11_SOLCO|nr:hypothetical protein H5410_048414 [Solanum commersonii]